MLVIAEHNEIFGVKLSAQEEDEEKFDKSEFNSDLSSRVSEIRSDSIYLQSVVETVLSKDNINVDFSSTSNSDSDSSHSLAYDLYD